MNIIEAAKAIDEGKRVRRKGDSLYLGYNTMSGMSFYADRHYGKMINTNCKLYLDDLLADDWEIVEQ